MFVVQTMRSRPPKRAFLRRGCPEKREEQLKCTARLVRAMREVPVVHAGDGKHAQNVCAQSNQNEPPCDFVQNRRQRDHVDRNERDGVVPLLLGETIGSFHRNFRWSSNGHCLFGLHRLSVSNGLQRSSRLAS